MLSAHILDLTAYFHHLSLVDCHLLTVGRGTPFRGLAVGHACTLNTTHHVDDSAWTAWMPCSCGGGACEGQGCAAGLGLGFRI